MDLNNLDMKKINDYRIIKELEQGASSVNKYLLEKDHNKYLLRLYDSRFMKSRYIAF